MFNYFTAIYGIVAVDCCHTYRSQLLSSRLTFLT